MENLNFAVEPKWEKVVGKEHIYRKAISKKEFVYKYRIRMVNGIGKVVDTEKKMNENRQPFKTLREVESHMNAFIKEQKELTADSGNIPQIYTLEEIYSHYLQNRGSTLAPNSISKHSGDMQNYIIPHFKKQDIRTITVGEVKNFIVKVRNKKAYSTTKSVLATMAKVFKYAAELEIITSEQYYQIFVDTIKKVTIDKKIPSEQATSTKKVEVFTNEQIDMFYAMAMAKDKAYYILLALCFYGGLRLSEGLGLMWNDIDFENGVISISKQRIYDKNQHTTYITPTKNKETRVFTAPPSLLTILAEWKSEQAENKKRLGRAYADKEVLFDSRTKKSIKGADFVLRTKNGEIITHSDANHFREKVQKETGLHFFYHGLRHTVVSTLVAKGVPLKNVSSFIGHADTRTTEKFYLGVEQIGANALQNALNTL